MEDQIKGETHHHLAYKSQFCYSSLHYLSYESFSKAGDQRNLLIKKHKKCISKLIGASAITWNIHARLSAWNCCPSGWAKLNIDYCSKGSIDIVGAEGI